MKLLLFLISVFMMLLTGCGKKEVLIPPAMPTDIVTLADAQNLTDATYRLKLNHDAVVKISDNVYRAEYLADPIGSGDPVVVTVTSPYGEVSLNDIKEMYKNEYKSRLNKKKVEGLGNGAFLVFPSLYIYNDGYMIEISAGSGNSDEQKEFLIELGQRAVMNLQTFLSEYKK